MGTPVVHTDIAIIGGGVAGLWTLNQLRNRGYSAILFEREALGSQQTIASQGMIHGGMKYALSGALSPGSETISAMPDTWRACLAGNGKVDLRGCRVLSEDFYLWSTGALQSRLGSFFASKMLRGRIDKVAPADYPAPLHNPAFTGQVYRLADLVLDVDSLLHTLAGHHPDAIFRIDWQTASLQRDKDRAVLSLPGCTVIPQRLVLAAGAGNEDLIADLGANAPAMQRRPLQQVMVRHQYPEPLFAHCLGNRPSPRLTISSHHTRAGDPVWYLGGDLATDGADEEPARLIDRAKAELAELLPWVDLGEASWQTLRLDRAEPRQSALLRPNSAFAGKVDGLVNTLATWPTKLTLSPDLADQVESELAAAAIEPCHQPDLEPLRSLGRPPFAQSCWDRVFL